MPVTITFYTVAEKEPLHGQDIIHLRPTSSFGYSGFEPQEIEAEYSWAELDDDGEDTGNSVCYNGNENPSEMTDHRLDILFDGYRATPYDLWVDAKEYWTYFDEHDKMVEKFEQEQYETYRLKIMKNVKGE